MSRTRLRRSRRPIEKLVLLILALATAGGFLGSFVIGYAVWHLDHVERFAVHDVLTAPVREPVTASDLIAIAASETERANDTLNDDENQTVLPPAVAEAPVDDDPDAENYLLVGSDSVDGIASDDVIMSGRRASIGNHLADTIMILRLRSDGTAAVVSVPRDLLVPIASTDAVAKINSAYNLDSSPQTRAARLIETVEQHFEIGLQHFVEVDLDGFRRLVNAVGGVSICLNRPTRDRTIQDSGDPTKGGTGFWENKGWTHLDGEAALAFVRSRRLLAQQDDGEWVRLGVWNDLERNSRQQRFIFEALDQTLDRAVGNPRTLQRLLTIVSTHLRTSNTLSVFDDGLELARRFRGLDVDDDLHRYAFQLVDVNLNGLAGLELIVNDHNQRVIDVFRGLDWDDVVEQRVRINTTGPAASQAAARLRGLGFKASHQKSEAYPLNRIRYGLGGDAAAVMLAAHLKETVPLVADPSLSGNNIRLELAAVPPTIVSGYRPVKAPLAVAAVPAAEAPPPPKALGVCGG
ncbi:MAG TPA: LytR family transcriptional regulator [Acidimicrobiia bacterium]|jgi:LCP family protein required for cell wall assembly|nr:LytR family transcriptional regulator [Acidimicrobiia bacterium]HIL05564.1 LytR family transcriptional regulator [Acidimicrobiia bacterium]